MRSGCWVSPTPGHRGTGAWAGASRAGPAGMAHRNACLAIVAVLMMSCGDESDFTRPCGNTTCGQSQVCCLGCGGDGACVTPGDSCPGVSCQPEESVDCGGTDCPSGASCCIDCDGTRQCAGPGGACAGPACGARCPLAPYFDQTCSDPADCVAVVQNRDCCGGGQIVAVNRSEESRFLDGQQPCYDELADCPPAGCFAPLLADDGSEVVSTETTSLRCIEGECHTAGAP